MPDFLTEAFVIGLLATTVRTAVPLLLAGLGEALSQRAGVINVGLEAYMLAGAFFGYLTSYYTGSVWFATLGGAAAGGLVALLAAYMIVTHQTDQIVTGLALLILMVGVVGVVYRTIFRSEFSFQPERVSVESFSAWEIPGLSQIKWIGDVLFVHGPIVYLAFVAVPVVWFIARSRLGLRIRAAGEHPLALETTGASVFRVRYFVIVLTGVLAGLGGVYLSIGQTQTFEEGLTGGRGFIVLGIAILGRRHPLGVLIAALIFAFADAIQLWLPTAGINVSHHLLAMLPYLVTIIALAGVIGRVRHPAAFLKPFARQT